MCCGHPEPGCQCGETKDCLGICGGTAVRDPLFNCCKKEDLNCGGFCPGGISFDTDDCGNCCLSEFIETGTIQTFRSRPCARSCRDNIPPNSCRPPFAVFQGPCKHFDHNDARGHLPRPVGNQSQPRAHKCKGPVGCGSVSCGGYQGEPGRAIDCTGQQTIRYCSTSTCFDDAFKKAKGQNSGCNGSNSSKCLDCLNCKKKKPRPKKGRRGPVIVVAPARRRCPGAAGCGCPNGQSPDCQGKCGGSAVSNECGCNNPGVYDLGCGCGNSAPVCGVCDGSIKDLGCGCGNPGPDPICGCDGTTADCNGVCGGSAEDLGCGCGNPPPDCAGVCGGTSEDLGCGCGNPAPNECGDCRHVEVRDCDGVCGGSNFDCPPCDGFVDCKGVCKGGAVETACGCDVDPPNICGSCPGDSPFLEELGCGCGNPAPDPNCGCDSVDLGCGCGEDAPVNNSCVPPSGITGGACADGEEDLGCGCGEDAPDCGVCDGSIGRDCSGTCGGTDFTSCPTCPSGIYDCNGVCDGTAVETACGCGAPPPVCGVCDGSVVNLGCGCGQPARGPCGCNDAKADCAGVCGGSAQDLGCGCSTIPEVDLGCGCGQPGLNHNGQCTGDPDFEYFVDVYCPEGYDCAGVCGGRSLTDCNRECFLPEDPDADFESCSCPQGYDCNGVCGGSAIADCSGDCAGTLLDLGCGCGKPAKIPGCECGEFDAGCGCGNPPKDPECNECNVQNLGCGCGNPGPNECGVCDGSIVKDCAGVCGGSAVFDCAGICNGSTIFDCANECGGRATLDCEGVCGGSAKVDCCGVCGGDSEYDCAGICGGNHIICEGKCIAK